jgi:hypothetical protein
MIVSGCGVQQQIPGIKMVSNVWDLLWHLYLQIVPQVLTEAQCFVVVGCMSFLKRMAIRSCWAGYQVIVSLRG